MSKRYGLIGDVHSNIEGLTNVLNALEQEEVDEILCLGDIVGYGASPCECIDTVFERCSHVIQGNHDRFIQGELRDGLRESVVRSAEWGRTKISAEQLKLLANSPETDVIDHLLLIVHGSPRHRDEYLLSQETIQKSLKVMRSKFQGLDVCFYGHTHLPFFIGGGKALADFKERRTIQMERLKTYLINPGSCGQPRDKCPAASCGVFDASEWTMTHIRVDYDIAAAQKKIEEAGLDPWYADRLGVGR